VPGVIDPLYVLARRTLLDALDALGGQRTAVILVGAQAIYLHTGDAHLAVAPFTTDADIAFDPDALRPSPRLEDAMRAAGFQAAPDQIGIWVRQGEGVTVDLLVPEAVGGPGRRGARLAEHGSRVARKARGLEACLVDKSSMAIEALEEGDPRRAETNVAGPAALLVAKLHKLEDREGAPDRLADKDALDVFRLLRAIPTEQLAATFPRLVADGRSAEVTQQAIRYLPRLFGEAAGLGCQMAARAASPSEDPATTAAAAAALAGDLLRALEAGVR